VLERDRRAKPIHVLWGLERRRPSPAVLVTAYRPDPARWSLDYLKREAR
jgi:hypothetical protein